MDKQVEKLLQAEQQMNEQVRQAQQARNEKMVEIEENVRSQVANLQRRLKEETREKIAGVSLLIHFQFRKCYSKLFPCLEFAQDDSS